MSTIEMLSPRPATALPRAEAEDFLFHEASLLDERRFEEWESLFTPEGYYWVPMRADQTDPLAEVSIFYDDRQLLRTRIERLRHPRIHIQDPPSRTCHIVSNVRIEPVESALNAVTVHSSLQMCEYRLGEQRLFAGHCKHALRQIDGKWRIAWKRVDLINAEDVFNPIAIFF